MKAVLHALFSVSFFMLLLAGANNVHAQTNNPPAKAPDAQQVSGSVQVPSNASIKDAANQQNNQQTGNQQPVQLDQNLLNALTQALANAQNELQQMQANDPNRSRVEEKIQRLQNQLNNQ